MIVFRFVPSRTAPRCSVCAGDIPHRHWKDGDERWHVLPRYATHSDAIRDGADMQIDVYDEWNQTYTGPTETTKEAIMAGKKPVPKMKPPMKGKKGC